MLLAYYGFCQVDDAQLLKHEGVVNASNYRIYLSRLMKLCFPITKPAPDWYVLWCIYVMRRREMIWCKMFQYFLPIYVVVRLELQRKKYFLLILL